MTAAVRTEALTKYYGPVVGVEDLTLSVEPGETFGFLGANGSGKTTTIRLLLDLLRPSSGRAFLAGFDCHRDSLAARALASYLPAEMPVYPEMSGAAYLQFLASLQTPRPRAARLADLFRRFDVSDVDLRRPIRDLSHGMKRKLGIIQALMGDNVILILDEPTSGLDPLMIEAFAETIRERRTNGTTVFLSSHVLSEVEKLCDRIGLVARGRLVKTATLAQVREELPRRVRITFDAPVPPLRLEGPAIVGAQCTEREWRLDVRGPLGPLLAHVASLPVSDIDTRAATLEDYVLGLYAEAR